MSRARYLVSLSALASCAALLIAFNFPARRGSNPASPVPRTRRVRPVSIPLSLEANVGQADSRVALLARGRHLSTFLTNRGIEIEPAAGANTRHAHPRIHIGFTNAAAVSPSVWTSIPNPAPHNNVVWKGVERIRTESNYFIGARPSNWHTHVPHFARAQARSVLPGIDVVAHTTAGGGGVAPESDEGQDDTQIEFDLHIAPTADAGHLRLGISGANQLRLSPEGDLLMFLDGVQVRMHKPTLYEVMAETGRQRRTAVRTAGILPALLPSPPFDKPSTRRRPSALKADPRTSRLIRSPIDGAYLLEPDGSVGFRIGKRNPRAALVIDPSLSVVYSTFLGGAGEDTANSIALDSAGKLYVGGTTTSASTFSETVTKQNGPGGGSTDFYVAKIDPSASGASSLVYLTFLGGSGAESGGLVAVDKSGNLAITGTTTSPDFPVTDGSKLTTGANDIAVAELGPTGATLVYATLFGGSGAESTQNSGGIALDPAGEIYIASDTTSKDLPVTAGAFQIANGGGVSDGFLAVFRTTTSPHLRYCTYLGINAQVGVGGVAVDSGSNAYIAGSTSDPGTTFPTLNGFQTTYAGDPYDGFVIKIRPSGTGASDLAYGTFLGGSSLDQALAIAVGTSMPATAYVTGTTHSADFPTNGASAPAQATRKGTANSFFAAIAQNATTGMTSLLYSTYLGGTQSDFGLSVSAVAPTAVYITGKTTSWDFPWLNNFQPFNGNEDAFVAKFDPTSAGAASLIYATPLAGTAPPGGTAITDGNAIAADELGQVYVAGRSTAADFPRAGNPGNGFQPVCASCQQLLPAADAFVSAIQESSIPAPSVSFSSLNINFGAQSVGAQNIPPLFASLINTGDAPLTVSSIAIAGPASSSFSFVGSDPCIGTPLPPRATCSFEVSFSPMAVGPAEAFATVTDDAPGSPQVLAIVGLGAGPLAVLSTSNIDFGAQPQGSSSSSQTVTILNEGNQNLVVSVPSLAGANPTEFGVTAFTCGSNAVPPGGNCEISVAFTPHGTGSFQAEVDVIDNSGGIAGAKQVIALSGTGVAPAPIVNITPLSLTFGILAVGTSSAAQMITLKNLGSTALTLSQLLLTGNDAASFAIAPAGTSCPTSGGALAIAASCIVAINFSPQTPGPNNANLSFVDNASGSPQIIPLSGTAIAPTISISPTSLTFAPQSVGTSSAPQTLTLLNTGTSAVAINQISLAGANAGDFSQTNNCSSVLGTSSSCVVNVIFKPVAAGNRAASILASDNAAGNPHSVPLAGTATQAAISISPSAANFANQLVGSASPPLAITVTNSGTGVLQVGAISFSGPNSADFVEKDTCKGTVAPPANCVINVTFTPAALGARTATLTLTDNAPDTPQSVTLSGAGIDFAIDASGIGATSATVVAGQTAAYMLNVQSMNGFAGQVTFACASSGLPAGATCSFVPATLTVTANASAAFQVNISTTARTAAAATTTHAATGTAATHAGAGTAVSATAVATAAATSIFPDLAAANANTNANANANAGTAAAGDAAANSLPTDSPSTKSDSPPHSIAEIAVLQNPLRASRNRPEHPATLRSHFTRTLAVLAILLLSLAVLLVRSASAPSVPGKLPAPQSPPPARIAHATAIKCLFAIPSPPLPVALSVPRKLRGSKSPAHSTIAPITAFASKESVALTVPRILRTLQSQAFAKIAATTALACILTMAEASCGGAGGGGIAGQTSGTPAGTYAITLTASTSAPSPGSTRTISLALTVQ